MEINQMKPNTEYEQSGQVKEQKTVSIEETKKTPQESSKKIDQYVSGVESEMKGAGIYSISKDSDGKVKIDYEKAGSLKTVTWDGKVKTEDAISQTEGNPQNNKKVNELNEKRDKIKQQIQKSSGDKQKVAELKKKLEEVEQQIKMVQGKQ